MGVGGMSVREGESGDDDDDSGGVDDDDDDDDNDGGPSASSGRAAEGVIADADVGIADVAYSRLRVVFVDTLAGLCLPDVL